MIFPSSQVEIVFVSPAREIIGQHSLHASSRQVWVWIFDFDTFPLHQQVWIVFLICRLGNGLTLTPECERSLLIVSRSFVSKIILPASFRDALSASTYEIVWKIWSESLQDKQSEQNVQTLANKRKKIYKQNLRTWRETIHVQLQLVIQPLQV